MLGLWKKSYDQPRQHIKKQRYYFVGKGLVKAMVIPVVMYGCDSWIIKKAEDWRIDDFEVWCWRKFLRVLWTARRSNQSINPRGNQSWIFTGKTDPEAPILWPLVAKSQLIGKDPDARKDWRQEAKGTTEDEMVGWYHRLSGHEFEQTLGDGKGQESLCFSPWGRKESDTTERLNSKIFRSTWTQVLFKNFIPF